MLEGTKPHRLMRLRSGQFAPNHGGRSPVFFIALFIEGNPTGDPDCLTFAHGSARPWSQSQYPCLRGASEMQRQWLLRQANLAEKSL